MIPGWKEEIEGEYLTFLRELPKATPADVAARFGVSECCAVYWLTDMAREGKLRILAFEFVEAGETPCDPRSAKSCQRKAFCPVNQWDSVLKNK